MGGRSFTVRRIEVGGKAGWAHSIMCDYCGHVELYQFKRGVVKRPPEAVIKHFTFLGWRISANDKKDLCPRCRVGAGGAGGADFIKKEGLSMGKVTEKVVAPALRAELPALPTIEDKRLINIKLSEVYGDGGYESPWTDRKVADDLSVPRAWVADIRENFYGPDASNPVLDEFLASQKAFAKDVEAFSLARVELAELARAADQAMKAACQKVSDHAKAVRQKGDDLDARRRDLEALARRVEKEVGR